MASANYSQSDYREAYSGKGRLAGWTIDDVAEALRTGKLGPKDVVVDVVRRKGQWLMHNTRSPQALLRAGIPRDEWYIRDMTDDARARKGVERQLRRNNLENSGGTPTVTSKKESGEPE
jgi:filamentous hemagglutinin